jgi:hypothetical protein
VYNTVGTVEIGTNNSGIAIDRYGSTCNNYLNRVAAKGIQYIGTVSKICREDAGINNVVEQDVTQLIFGQAPRVPAGRFPKASSVGANTV